jgi:hypothetical protein
MTGVGDEVDAQALDPPRFGLVASVASGATQTSNSRSTGTRSLHCTVSASPLAITRRRASMTSGARRPSTNGSPTLSPGRSSNAGLLAAAARSSGPTMIAGSGIAPTSCDANGDPTRSARL